MHYALRNKEKLIEAFDSEFYRTLEASIDWAIALNRQLKREFQQLESDKPKYKMIQVKEINGERIFEFYVVSITYDCWVLGYKGGK